MKYFLKTKGTLEIPDYLQIRDEDFKLIAHCTVKNASFVVGKYSIKITSQDIKKFVQDLPFGKLIRVEES